MRNWYPQRALFQLPNDNFVRFILFARWFISSKTGPVPYTRRFTWEAMTSYIADSTVGDELNQEHHWRTQFYHCGICSVDYNLITQLEHAKEETNWILEIKKWKGTVFNCSLTSKRNILAFDKHFDEHLETVSRNNTLWSSIYPCTKTFSTTFGRRVDSVEWIRTKFSRPKTFGPMEIAE